MRRRRNSSITTISLFSFQDIMTTVIGILIVVALLMALELTMRVGLAAEAAPFDPAPAEQSRAEIQALIHAESTLRQQFEEALADLGRLAAMSGEEARQRVEEDRQRLIVLYEEIRQVQEQVEQLSAQLAARSPHLAARQSLALRLEHRVEQTAAAIEGEKLHPRLTYILQDNAGKSPILLDLSDRRIGVGAAHEQAAVLWLAAEDPRLRFEQFKALAAGYNRQSDYFVIILRPSAFGETYEVVWEWLKTQGFDVGTELVMEDAPVLTPP